MKGDVTLHMVEIHIVLKSYNNVMFSDNLV